MDQVEIKINGLEFTVKLDGTILQPCRVSTTFLDDVRIVAAHQFLANKGLTKADREYWKAISGRSQVH